MSIGIPHFFCFFMKNKLKTETVAIFAYLIYNIEEYNCTKGNILMPNFQYNADFIPVSADFIENKMTDANGAYVKVYLYMLDLAFRNEYEENSVIAKKLNLLESDVVNAVDYWKNNGALTYENDNIIFGNAPVRKQAEIPAPVPESKTEKDIAKIMSENKALADLCLLAQEILGKTLSTKETETLFWFYDYLGFSAEVISMLLEYCVSKNKRNMNYIEKVAISWHENGITTMSAAESYISNEQEKKTYTYELKKLFGIENRNLSKSEELYLKTWHDDYDMSLEMIALAYEYCIMSTNKLSFPYMNRIIENWYHQNIRTIEDAEKDHEDFKSKNKGFSEKDTKVFSDGEYDYDEIEKIMHRKYDE